MISTTYQAAERVDSRERTGIQVRLQRDERDDLERLGDVLVAAPGGKHIPLGQLATIRRATGPSEIASENGRLRVFVQANVQDRDLTGFVEDLKQRVEIEIVPTLPPGMTIEYSGEYENLVRAQQTLFYIFPATLLIIFLLLYMVYHSAKEAAHVILAVPFALTGGVLLQGWLGYNFSVAVWVGYIALFGTAIQTGVIMVIYLEEALARRRAELGAAPAGRTADAACPGSSCATPAASSTSAARCARRSSPCDRDRKRCAWPAATTCPRSRQRSTGDTSPSPR